MKNNFAIRLCLFITMALLAVPSSIRAQYTKEWPYSDSMSLVRRINATDYLLYSDNGSKYFYHYTSTGFMTMFKLFNNRNLIINDFEISKDTVYFCGHLNEDGGTMAILGYFPLNNFPLGDVRYDSQSGMQDFKKIDVYRVNNQAHAVMTATDEDGVSAMVDAFCANDTNWYYYVAYGKGNDEVFDDVAVISTSFDSYVVFSSRDQSDFVSVFPTYSAAWLFVIPTIINTPVFANPLNYLKLIKAPRSPVLAESMHGWFATAYSIGNDTILVNRFAPTAYDRSVRILGNPTTTLKDIQYNDYLAFPLDILATQRTSTSVRSIIYHVPEYYFDTNMAMNTHIFDGEDINSLALLSNTNCSYVASGHNGATSMLRAYNYKHGDWTCSVKKSASPFNFKYDSGESGINTYIRIIKRPFVLMNHNYGGISLETICGE